MEVSTCRRIFDKYIPGTPLVYARVREECVLHLKVKKKENEPL